jgi:cell division protein FtsW
MSRLKTDKILFGAVLVILSFGVLMLYSASSWMAKIEFGSSWHFVVRQAEWAALAIIAMMVFKTTPYRKFQNRALAFTALGISFLLLVAVYFIDAKHHRWLRFGTGGFASWVGFQPSELAKPVLVIFLAFFVAWRGRAINNRRYTLFPAAMALGLLIGGVAMADLGTPILMGAAVVAVFFVAGLEMRYCFAVVAVGLLGVVVFIFAEPYRLGRVVKFFDPDFKLISRFDPSGTIKARTEQTLRTRDTNYQLEQSEIALGAGGAFGVGLMNGRQKLLYLPFAHTDFIYAVVGEETGMLGAAGVLLAFLVVAWRGLRAAFRMSDDFGRYLALGITMMLIVQVLMNVSVVLGMAPTKGIALPMISYGGSSLVGTLAMLGMLMNVSEHAG